MSRGCLTQTSTPSSLINYISSPLPASQILEQVQLSRLATEKERSARLLDLHRRAFVTQQSVKQFELNAIGITHCRLVPEYVASAHYKVGQTSRSQQQ